MIIIDGSYGEGGGQILRSALALSLVTGKPFRIEKIRAGRSKPGLLRQHLTAVNAACSVGNAKAEGAVMGSTQLTFQPGAIKAGEYAFAVGTAGSATLVLQTILPALLQAGAPCVLSLEGGTHNPFAPPFNFLEKAFLPLLRRMGVDIHVRLERYGFYPAGGGKFIVELTPPTQLQPLTLSERGAIVQRRARALVANLPRRIAEREVKVVAQYTSWPPDTLRVEEVSNSAGPGNLISLEIECENVTEVFVGFGEKNVAAELVAEQAVKQYRNYLSAEVAVGEYLADQLLLPMALAGGGSFTTVAPSRHTTTNIEIIRKFLPVNITCEKQGERSWLIEVMG